MERQDEMTFAMTLGGDVQKSEIVAALAGSRAADVAQSGPNSPKGILETIWGHMAKLSLSTSDPTL